MHPRLALLLTQRYPELYSLAKGRNGFQFAHHDGWFVVIDALSEVLTRRAVVEGRPVQPAQQIKEKYGTLRFYFGNGEADDGAIDMAEEMSGRLCEITGRPGRLGSRCGWWATRAPGLDDLQFVEASAGEDDRLGVPSLGVTAADVQVWRSDVLGTADRGSPDLTLDVPKGWVDLTDGMLRQLAEVRTTFRIYPEEAIVTSASQEAHGEVVPVRVDRVDVGPTGVLRVEHIGGGPYAAGVVAMAIALSRRLDSVTGAAKAPE